jgi:lipopolysaccharide/colanic/teichoic acid biosynthesis glycosyltransferase
VESRYVADIFDPSLAEPRPATIGWTPTIAMVVAPDDYRLLIKRGIDVLAVLLSLPLVLPLAACIAVAVKLTTRGPVLFRQERFGYRKRRFWMYKFRTMVVGAETMLASLESQNEATGPVFKITNDPRVTPLGRALRKSSLDELPQLWNVIRGEMSLVGPRPLAIRDVKLFSDAALMRRFSARPGLTCLWQVSGRSNLDFDRWVDLDLQYIDNWSLRLDAQILARTIPAVLSGTGAI